MYSFKAKKINSVLSIITTYVPYSLVQFSMSFKYFGKRVKVGMTLIKPRKSCY